MPTEGVKFSRMSVTCDASKAVRELGYAPTPFEDTLAKAVAWYRKNAYVEPRGIFRIKAHGSRIVRRVMQALGMDKFTDKLNFGTLTFFLMVKFLGFLRKAGVAGNTDGWRKGAQCYLRTEQSKFVLAAFGLDFRSDLKNGLDNSEESAKRHCLQRLARFLRAYPVFHQRLQWGVFHAACRPRPFLDIVEAHFDTDGNLSRIAPCFDEGPAIENFEAMPAHVKDLLIEGIIQNYNKTRDHADKKRPLVLEKQWKHWLSRHSGSIPEEWRTRAAEFGGRVLSAAFIQFEARSNVLSVSEAGRFQAPSFVKRKHPGFGILNMVCRFTGSFEAADLWVQFSHIPLDGVPAQEILNDLKRQWGTRGEIFFPGPGDEKGNAPETCSSARGKGEVCQAYQFLDFQPFLKLRNELNKRFGRRAGQVISSAALLLWKLAQYKEFEDIKFSVPVDLRAAPGQPRTLGFIFIRPSTYFDRHRPDRGFFAFQQEFNRQLFSTRKRRSESYWLLNAYAVAAPVIYAGVAKFLARPFQSFSGTLGVSIIKKADFFVAPASDVHTDGFLSFGNFSLPTANGGKVCVVSLKGPREKVHKYMEVLYDVMHRAVSYDELYF